MSLYRFRDVGPGTYEVTRVGPEKLAGSVIGKAIRRHTIKRSDGQWAAIAPDGSQIDRAYTRGEAADSLWRVFKRASARPASESAPQGSASEPIACPVPAGAGGMGKGEGREG